MLYRLLMTLITVAGLSAAALTVVSFAQRTHDRRLGGRHWIRLITYDGRAVVHFVDANSAYAMDLFVHPDRLELLECSGGLPWWQDDLYTVRRKDLLGSGDWLRTRTLALVPWHWTSLLLLWPATAVIRGPLRRRHRRKRGLCPRCAFDLTGLTSGRCPECGGTVSSGESASTA